MEAVKIRAFEVFDLLPERKQNLVYELIMSLVPDNIATPEDIDYHHTAIEEYRRGETVDHDNINWD